MCSRRRAPARIVEVPNQRCHPRTVVDLGLARRRRSEMTADNPALAGTIKTILAWQPVWFRRIEKAHRRHWHRRPDRRGGIFVHGTAMRNQIPDFRSTGSD
jgi:ribosomal protein L30/L7E